MNEILYPFTLVGIAQIGCESWCPPHLLLSFDKEGFDTSITKRHLCLISLQIQLNTNTQMITSKVRVESTSRCCLRVSFNLYSPTDVSDTDIFGYFGHQNRLFRFSVCYLVSGWAEFQGVKSSLRWLPIRMYVGDMFYWNTIHVLRWLIKNIKTEDSWPADISCSKVANSVATIKRVSSNQSGTWGVQSPIKNSLCLLSVAL